jgi:hypothetical protein
MRFLFEEVDPGQGRMGIEDPNAAGEAAFHKFLAADAAATGWSCTALASTLAFVQARVLQAQRRLAPRVMRAAGPGGAGLQRRRGGAAGCAARLKKATRSLAALRVSRCRARPAPPADIPAPQVLQLAHAAGATLRRPAQTAQRARPRSPQP